MPAINALIALILTSLVPMISGPPAGDAPAVKTGSAQEVLAAEFPGLSPTEPDRFRPELRAALGGSASRHPGRTHGDFDGDGRQDLALMLAGAGEHQVVLLFARGEQVWQIHLLARSPGSLPPPAATYLRTLPAGPIVIRDAGGDPAGVRTVKVLTDALELGQWGGEASVTYWDGGRPITVSRPAIGPEPPAGD